MAVRISVVIATYNTGEHIEPLIDSLTGTPGGPGQTMPAADFEVIFVDDGSTDGTPARLDRLAAAVDNVTVVHEPNSGWPGRPRNVGTDLATGDYVFFADHDDWFTPEALQRMADYADSNGADVLVPRYIGLNRGVARVLFDRPRPDATLAKDPLMDSLTPHKLFRRAFLIEHGLRFPEGRRRLEDHVFVVEAYFLAQRISVLSDHPCYVHVGRGDRGNAAFERIDPPSYYGYVREVVDIIVRHTEPGALRDRCLRRPLRQEILGRLEGAKFLAQDREYQRSLFDEGGRVAREAIAPSADLGLSPQQRVRAALLRAGRFDELLDYARGLVGQRVTATRHTYTLTRRLLTLDVDAALVTADGTPWPYVRRGDEVHVSAPDLDDLPSSATECTRDLANGAARLYVRRRGTSEEWVLPAESTQQTTVDGDRLSVSYRVRASVDVPAFRDGWLQTGEPWDVWVQVAQTGWKTQVKLNRPATPRSPTRRRVRRVIRLARRVRRALRARLPWAAATRGRQR